MQPPRPRSQHRWSFTRQKPQLLHLTAGAGAATLLYYLTSQFSQQLLAETTTQLLRLGQITVEKSLNQETPTLILTLNDGSNLNLALTWQHTGIFTILIYSLLFVFLAFPLEGSLWRKLAWLGFGNAAGLTWSLLRLSTLALIAYNFGQSQLAVAEFVVSPILDFLWVIPVWATGLSAVTSPSRKAFTPS